MTETSRTWWPAMIAPVGLLGGWLLLRVIDGDTVPGFWWTAAHAVWLLGFVAFAAVGLRLRRCTRPGVVGPLLGWVVVVSAVINVIQMTVDLVAGGLASSPDELDDTLDAIADLPVVAPMVYDVGPHLIFVALAGLAGLLAYRRAIPWWTAAVTVVGVATLALALVVGRGHPVAGVGMLLLAAGMTCSAVLARPPSRASVS